LSFLAPLQRPRVQITVLAVVVGVQASSVISSVLHAVAQVFHVFVYPARVQGGDLLRIFKSSLLLVLTQAAFSAVVAALCIWLLARLLAQNPGLTE
jgi:hypothetical protein